MLLHRQRFPGAKLSMFQDLVMYYWNVQIQQTLEITHPACQTKTLTRFDSEIVNVVCSYVVI